MVHLGQMLRHEHKVTLQWNNSADGRKDATKGVSNFCNVP